MAEGLAVAGSVVGIASIAIQLVDTVQQLKSFVGDVRHAPQDVAEMLEHVDTLGEMIQNIAAEEQEHPNAFARNKSLQTCLTRCDDKIRAISTLLKQLAESVRKSRLKGSLRTVFRTRDVQKLTDKLEKAQELLAFAYQIYTNSLIREINREGTQMIITEVQKMHLVVQSQASSSSSDCSFALAGMNQQSLASDPRISTLSLVSAKSASPQCETVPSCTAEREENRKSICQSARTTYRFRVPIWFTSRYWEIQLRRAQSGWDNKIRTYNVVPNSSLIFRYCSDLDIEAVRYLFQQGRASPFDRSPNGRTLLHYVTFANIYRQDTGGLKELCRVLLEAGIDASTPDNNGVTCASDFCLCNSQDSSWVATWDILAANAGIDNDGLLDIDLHPLVTCWTPEAIMAVRRHMYPPLEDRSYGVRARFAIAGSRYGSIWHNFRARLGCDPTDPNLLTSILPDHDLMADYLATIAKIFAKTGALNKSKVGPHLWGLIAIAAKHGTNLQADQYMSLGGMTLMHVFLKYHLSTSKKNFCTEPGLQGEEACRVWCEESIRKAVRVWIDGLVTSGLDLHDFEMRERVATDFRYRFEDDFWWSWRSGLNSFTTIDMSCGAQAADWDMAFSWRLNQDDIPEELATQFWHMIERPMQAMPGTWKEEWDAPELTTYYSQRERPSRHWMKKRVSMIADGIWPDEWDYWDEDWCKKHILTNPCKRCVSRKLCSEHRDFECRLCFYSQCRQHVRISPCLRCANWCKIHFLERPCSDCKLYNRCELYY